MNNLTSLSADSKSTIFKIGGALLRAQVRVLIKAHFNVEVLPIPFCVIGFLRTLHQTCHYRPYPRLQTIRLVFVWPPYHIIVMKLHTHQGEK